MMIAMEGSDLATLVTYVPRVVTVADDNTATLWDAATGRRVASYEGHKHRIDSVGFSPDSGGGRVLTASADHSAKLRDERTGKLASFEGDTDILLDARFSADGTRVMTASDSAISTWDIHLEQRDPDAIRNALGGSCAGRRILGRRPQHVGRFTRLRPRGSRSGDAMICLVQRG